MNAESMIRVATVPQARSSLMLRTLAIGRGRCSFCHTVERAARRTPPRRSSQRARASDERIVDGRGDWCVSAPLARNAVWAGGWGAREAEEEASRGCRKKGRVL